MDSVLEIMFQHFPLWSTKRAAYTVRPVEELAFGHFQKLEEGQAWEKFYPLFEKKLKENNRAFGTITFFLSLIYLPGLF